MDGKRSLVRWPWVLPLALAAFLAGPSAQADVREGALELGGFGGIYIMEGNQQLADTYSAGLKAGYFFTRDLELEFTFAATPSEYDLPRSSLFAGLDGRDMDIYHFRFETLYHLPTFAERLVPYLALGGGFARLDGATVDSKVDAEVGYGLGMKLFVLEDLALRVDARHIVLFDKWIRNAVDSDGNIVKRGSKHWNNLEVTGGVTFLFGGGARDEDADGVADDLDACPGTPAGCRVDGRGCHLDSDGDGVCDGLDQCAGTPKGAWVDAKGCPRDSDGDGVLDGLDLCPDTPAGVKVNEQGCPIDADGDGVPDGVDQCPNTPKGCRVDPKGCPLDGDGDKVCDGLDQCPDTPKGVKVDATGCSGFKGGVLEGITFAFDSARIDPQSYPVLDEVAAALKAKPSLVVEIGGHTDARGRAAYNQRLSQQRAQAVRDYLVSKGIAPSRLTVKGYGAAFPIATNETEQGRAKNRRIEFKILSQ